MIAATALAGRFSPRRECRWSECGLAAARAPPAAWDSSPLRQPHLSAILPHPSASLAAKDCGPNAAKRVGFSRLGRKEKQAKAIEWKPFSAAMRRKEVARAKRNAWEDEALERVAAELADADSVDLEDVRTDGSRAAVVQRDDALADAPMVAVVAVDVDAVERWAVDDEDEEERAERDNLRRSFHQRPYDGPERA